MKLMIFPLMCTITVACSTPANPPSLLPRAIETQRDTPTERPVMPIAKALDPALAAKITALLREARAGDADFRKTESAGSATLASGRNAATGSEAWIASEVIISALQVARQRSAAALAEIDTLAIDQGVLASRDQTIGGMFEIATAQTEIEAIVARQTARLVVFSR